jgi:hypothetical protein
VGTFQCFRYTVLTRPNRRKQLSTVSRCTGSLSLVILVSKG